MPLVLIKPTEIRIMVRKDDNTIVNIDGEVIGSSGKGEEYDHALFQAPSWVVRLPHNISYYEDEDVQGTLKAIVFLTFENMIKITKGSKLDPYYIEIADEDHFAFYADGVDRKKGGAKKRRRTRRRNRRERRKSSKRRKR